MPVGPGVYDDEAIMFRATTGARAVIVLVIGGHSGNGFSVQTENVDEVSTRMIARMLRAVAAELEALEVEAPT